MLNDYDRWYCPDNYVDHVEADNVVHAGDWRREVSNARTLQPLRSAIRRGPASAFHLRDKLADYFLNEGSLLFQDDMDLNAHGPY